MAPVSQTLYVRSLSSNFHHFHEWTSRYYSNSQTKLTCASFLPFPIYQKPQKSLKELAKENPTRLGDPVSLKAETSNTEPTDNDRGGAAAAGTNAKPSRKHLSPNNVKSLAPTEGDQDDDDDSNAKGKKKSLKEMAQDNPTMLGDPVSLKAETSDTEPTDEDRGAAAAGKGKESSRKSKL